MISISYDLCKQTSHFHIYFPKIVDSRALGKRFLAAGPDEPLVRLQCSVATAVLLVGTRLVITRTLAHIGDQVTVREISQIAYYI